MLSHPRYHVRRMGWREIQLAQCGKTKAQPRDRGSTPRALDVTGRAAGGNIPSELVVRQ